VDCYCCLMGSLTLNREKAPSQIERSVGRAVSTNRAQLSNCSQSMFGTLLGGGRQTQLAQHVVGCMVRHELILDAAGQRPWRHRRTRRGWVAVDNDQLSDRPTSDGVGFVQRLTLVPVDPAQQSTLRNLHRHLTLCTRCRQNFLSNPLFADLQTTSVYQ